MVILLIATITALTVNITEMRHTHYALQCGSQFKVFIATSAVIKQFLKAICRCSFIENRANTNKALDSFYDIGPMSCGGGVYIGFAVRASYLDITLENCIIQYNSAAEYSGGLKLEIYEAAQHNQILLLGTTLSNNNVPNLEIAFLPFRHQMEHNSITVISCDFTSNFAGSGGGLNIFSHELPFQNDLSAITFTDCTWTNNTALYGAAVQIVPATWASGSQGRNQLVSFVKLSCLIVKKTKVTRTIE